MGRRETNGLYDLVTRDAGGGGVPFNGGVFTAWRPAEELARRRCKGVESGKEPEPTTAVARRRVGTFIKEALWRKGTDIKVAGGRYVKFAQRWLLSKVQLRLVRRRQRLSR